jgi:hypothetical protein
MERPVELAPISTAGVETGSLSLAFGTAALYKWQLHDIRADA